MSRTHLTCRAGVAALATLALAACTPTAGNKAGGPVEPVTLQMATVVGVPGFMPQIDYLVNRVDKLSAGNVKINMVYDVSHETPDAEQRVVRDVAAGTYDLGVVGTRVFDTLGVNSFQALTAPMLIDSYPLEQAVIASDIPARMMRSLDQLNVIGLAVLADGLRKPIAVKKPLLGTNDWRGIRFSAYRSKEASEAIRALGARPSDLWATPVDERRDSRQQQGFDKSLFLYRVANLWKRASYVTANVNLWPQTLAVIGNPDRLAGLASQQRDWLAQAGREAVAASTGLVDGDQGQISDLCTDGARFANASDADIGALKNAFASVYATLRKDPQTERLIAEIERLKWQTPPGQALVIPEDCTGVVAPRPASTGTPVETQPKTTEVTPLDGTWEVTYTKDELVAAHADPSEVVPENYGHLTMAFHRGDWEAGLTGTYTVNGDTITFFAPGPAGPEVWRYRWSVYRDTLTFEQLGGDSPDCSPSASLGRCEPTTLVVKPWRRISS